MTKDEALKLALDYIVATNKSSEFWLVPHSNLNKAVTAIKEALAQQEQEPVAWTWQQAPIRTAWGDDMVVASVAIDKNHTVDLYCEREQIAKVEVMFTSPSAQQEPVAWPKAKLAEQIIGWTLDYKFLESLSDAADGRPSMETVESVLLLAVKQMKSATLPQRDWVGLTEQEIDNIRTRFYRLQGPNEFARAIEDALRSTNA